MKKFLSLLLTAAMLLLCVGCGSKTTAKENVSATDVTAEATPAPTAEPTPEPTPEPTEEPDDTVANIMVLNGTTGFGMAKLIVDSQNGETEGNYSFSVESDTSNVTAALINGSADIAALPTNAASVVYNKTEGGVQALALNTRGVLYLVTTDGTEVSSLADLEGETVYAPAQNPTFIFQTLCDAAGVNVTIDNTYAQPADLRTAVADGDVALAVLPEPMVTIARAANENVAVALDLTEQWDAVEPEGSLVQGCVVVRTEFAQEHPQVVAEFLAEYEASIDYMTSGATDAGTLIEQSGVFAKGAVAAKAIPNCNMCFVTGQDMKDDLSQFLGIMFESAPQSIGGAVPGDDFYYMG